MTRLEVGAASLVGRVRSVNEDSYFLADDLVVVADGMGGHLAGEVASADAVDAVGAAAGRRSLVDLVASVHLANRRISERAADDPELHGMGTTVCAVGLVDEDGEHVAVLNVGDSRVYLYAGGALTRLTEDHSLVETLVREGRITAAEAEVHPQRNVLTRALGVEPLVVVDAWLLVPSDEDRLLLCSDGLFNELTEERIGQILGEGADAEVTARRLAAEADAAGGRDNITAVVVDIRDSGSPPEPLGDRYRRIATPTVDPDDLDRDLNDTRTVPMVPVSAAPLIARDTDTDTDAGDTDDTAGPDASDEAPDGPRDEESAGRPDDADDTGGGGADEIDRDGDRDGPLAEDEDVRAEASASVALDAPPRRTWRVPLFVLAVLVVLGLALGIVVYYSGQGWFVGADDDAVAIYRGKPDSFLWLRPSVVVATDIQVDELRPNDRAVVQNRSRTFETRSRAENYVENLRRSTTTTSTTTTTTSTTTTTTTTTTEAPGAGP